MSEAVQLAKSARESLSQALNALQGNGAPPELLEVAEPIAQAMTVLHRVERSNGQQLEGRDVALNGVRAALDRLQKITANHPSVDRAMEAVAQSLSKVHALARFQPPAAQPAYVPPAQPTQPSPQAQQFQPQPQAQAINVRGGGTVQMPPEAGAAARAAAAQAQPQQGYAPQAYPQPQAQAYGPSQPYGQPPQQPYAQPQAQPQQPVYPQQPFNPPPPGAAPMATMPIQQGAMPQGAPQQPAYAQQAPQQQAYAQQPQQPYAQPQHGPSAQYGAPSQQPQASSRSQPMYPSQPQAAAPQPVARAAHPAPAEPPAAGPVPSVDVELGTHSTSNFYKGLGGNDVIEHGGVFVQTVRVPKIGSAVQLRVLMPGDYEFRAIGVVQWTRDGNSEGGAGFGARFTQISPEGRQLVYRYTRNREPMFYDDL